MVSVMPVFIVVILISLSQEPWILMQWLPYASYALPFIELSCYSEILSVSSR